MKSDDNKDSGMAFSKRVDTGSRSGHLQGECGPGDIPGTENDLSRGPDHPTHQPV